jgi:hypothetical protein
VRSQASGQTATTFHHNNVSHHTNNPRQTTFMMPSSNQKNAGSLMMQGLDHPSIMSSFEAKASNKNKVSNQNALLSLMSQDDFYRLNNEIHSVLKNQSVKEKIVEERAEVSSFDDGGSERECREADALSDSAAHNGVMSDDEAVVLT